MRHEGPFVSVPEEGNSIWKEALEKATNHTINSETWQARLEWRGVRVGFGHLVTDYDGNYDRKKPIFIEHTGGMSCENTISEISVKRKKQRESFEELEEEKAQEKAERKRQREIAEWNELRTRLLTRGKELGFLSTADELYISSIQSVPVPAISPQAPSYPYPISVTQEMTCHGIRYRKIIRNLTYRFAILGAPFSKIASFMKEVLEVAYPSEVYKLPSRKTIQNIVLEGGIISQLNALKYVHQMASPLLGHDAASSRGRNLLTLSALGSESEGCVILGTSEVVRKDAKSQADAISGMLDDFRVLSSLFPETSAFVSSLTIDKFIGTMSDHLSTNAATLKILNEENGTDLVDCKCSPHKSALVEKRFIKSLQSGCDNDVEPSEILEPDPGRNAKLSKDLRCTKNSLSFLYTLAKTLSPKGRDKYGFGAIFEAVQILEKNSFSLLPLDGKRFHIYSHTALQTYQHLPFLHRFLLEYMNKSTWSYQYLIAAINDRQCCSELRCLGLFSFLFGAPMMYTFRVYPIRLMSSLWKTIEKLCDEIQKEDAIFERHTLLWDLIYLNESSDKAKRKIVDHRHELSELLSPILVDWTPDDTHLFKMSFQSAKEEVLTIAKEYLSQGDMEYPPPMFQEKPSDNLDIESYFADYKCHDTKARQLSTASLVATVPRVRAEGEHFEPLVLSEESEAMVRKVAQLTYTQKEIDQQLAVEKEAKRKEELKRLEEKESRKRKREECLNLKLTTVQMVKNPAQFHGMSNEELKLQLYLWKSKGYKVALCKKKEERISQLERLLSCQTCCFSAKK